MGRFYYSVVKFVPHPVREESLNIGVVLISEGGEYSNYQFTDAYRAKLKALAPDVLPATVQRFIEDFQTRFPRSQPPQLQFDSGHESPISVLKELAGRSATQTRLTPPRAVNVDRPEETLKELFEEFVSPIRYSRETIIDKPAIRTSLRRSLKQWLPKHAIVENPQISVRRGFNTLDLGIRRMVRGKYHLALALEPLSFSIGGQDEIIRQRDHVAWVAYDSAKVNGDVAIGAVVSEATPPNQDLFERSLEIFQDTRVTVVPFREPEKLHALLERAKAV
jgi:hypothetical protein